MKRIISILLILLMLAGLATPVYAADATASTMRLSETEGSVTVENASGKELTLRDNLRLYNGYSIATEQESYAYISLDKSKAAKLDASSAAEVSKSGKKLELNVTAGSLMFNVPVSLEADESMNIRTSSMVAGIRGTSGWVHVLGRYTTRVSVLEGSVTVSSHHPLTGEPRSVTITGGQTVTIIDHARAEQMTQELINQGTIVEANIVEALTELGQVVEALNEDSVPGFVAAAIASDPPLREEINNNSPLDADKIAENAEQKLQEEQQEAKAQTLALEQQLENMAPADEIPQSPFAPGGALNQTETVVVTETVVAPGETVYVEVEKEVIKEVEKIVEVPGKTVYLAPKMVYSPKSVDSMNDVFTDAADVIMIVGAYIGDDYSEYSLAVDSSGYGVEEMTLPALLAQMEDDDTVYLMNCNITLDTDWTQKGTVTAVSTNIYNHAKINVNGTMKLVDSYLSNTYSLQIDDANSSDEQTEFIKIPAVINVNKSLEIQGSFDDYASLFNSGSIIVNGTLENYGNVINQGYIHNMGTINNYGIINNGNEGYGKSISYEEIIEDAYGSVFYNDNTINNYGYICNSGDFYNAGIISANGAQPQEPEDGEEYDEYGSPVAAITMCGGTLYMGPLPAPADSETAPLVSNPSITATGYAHAINYQYGKMYFYGGTISYAGDQSGYYPIYIEGYCGSYTCDTIAPGVVIAENPEQFVGGVAGRDGLLVAFSSECQFLNCNSTDTSISYYAPDDTNYNQPFMTIHYIEEANTYHLTSIHFHPGPQ